MAKRTLPPALKENAERLKRGESLHGGGKRSGKAASTSQKPKIRSKQKKG
jgi:hypothetical protein